MSFQISFCLFGGGVGGEKCFLALCALSLCPGSFWQRWIVFVCLSLSWAWGMSTEKGSHRVCLHKRPSALWGSPRVALGFRYRRSVPNRIVGESPFSAAQGAVELTAPLRHLWNGHWCFHTGTYSASCGQSLPSTQISSPGGDRAGEEGKGQSRWHVVTEDMKLWCVSGTSRVHLEGEELQV